jgi:hypothetical protein
MLNPSQYSSAPVAELLHEAALGRVGFDQRLYDAILARPAEAAKALLAFGAKPPEDARLEIDADILNLLSQLPEADALPYVFKLLSEGFVDLPESLVTIVRRFGARAVGPLLEAYEGLEEEAAGEVAFLLASLGVRDARIAKLIGERLEFDMEDGAMLAGLYGDPALIPVLEKYLAEVGRNRELEFAIENLKNPAAEMADPPYEPRDEYPEAVLPAFDVLEDDEILQLALGHEDDEVRLEALDILEDLDLSVRAVEPLLGLAQGPETATIRAAAWRALNRLQQVQEVRGAAEAALADEKLAPQIRVAALITLLPKYPFDQLKGYIESFLAIPEAKADAVQAMWRSREPFYGSSFGAFLDDTDLEVLRQAVRGAGVMGDKTALAKLREFFADEALRKDALFAYAMAVPTEVSASRMRSLLKRIDEEAKGLTQAETGDVQMALDMRLEAAGKKPVFFVEDEEDEEDGHVHGPNCGHVH